MIMVFKYFEGRKYGYEILGDCCIRGKLGLLRFFYERVNGFELDNG